MAVVRMNISVPEDLKARMDSVTEDTNWSNVACRAFEDRLGDLASRKREKNMQDVIERLRASKRASEDQDTAFGRESGEDWARNVAEAVELSRLEKAWNAYMSEITWEHEGHAANRVAVAVLGSSQLSRPAVTEFWESVLGDDHRRSLSNELVNGFIRGALDVWFEVKDHVG